jgi:hypothetical protein
MQRIAAGFHRLSKRDEMGGGVLWCVKRAGAMQLNRGEPPAFEGGGI